MLCAVLLCLKSCGGVLSMKSIIILILGFTLMFFDCSSKKDKNLNTEKPKPKVENNMKELLSFENRIEGIEYKFKAALKKSGTYDGIEYKNEFIEIEYVLNNTSEKDYIVFNKGHFGTNADVLYLEPNKDGTVEISQKAFEEPRDRNCPQRFVAITPKGTWMKSGEKITGKIQAEMPFETRTPFDDCEPKPQMPKEIKNVKFCIGILEADPGKVKLSDDGIISGMPSINEQKLLCSQAVKLK
jgi:hypothetical protein